MKIRHLFVSLSLHLIFALIFVKKAGIHTQFLWLSYQNCAGLRGSTQNYLRFSKYAEDKRKSFTALEKATTYLGSLR